MRFAPVAEYNDEKKVDPAYAPFADENAVVECDLKPKAVCSRTDANAIEFKLEEDSGPDDLEPNSRELLHIIKGTVGPLKNPWSTVDL
jgi:hypothetical protein